MKYTIILLAAVCAGVAFVQAEEPVDINGSFEKCRANPKGFVTPEGWVRDKQSKGVKFSASSEEVRTGKFAFYAEAEEKSLAHIYYNNAVIKAEAGETVTFTVYGKGSGTFQLGVIAYSDEEKGRFVCTLAGKAQKITDGENWKKFTFTVPIVKRKRNGREYTKLRLRPTIIIRDAGEFVLDDLTYEKKGTAE